MFGKRGHRAAAFLALSMVVPLLVPAVPFANAGTEVPVHEIHPGFETGDLTGWTVVEGGAFGPDSVSDETTWWAERIPYHQEGAHHLNGWKYPKAEAGIVRSSTFALGGSGWISFKLGGAKNPSKVFVNIVEADTGRVIARYGNSEFSDAGFPNPEAGMRLANLEQYKADLSNFVLGGNGRIDFLVSGGRDPERLYVALVRTSDGKELFRTTATDYEEYQRKIWDASAYIGEELYIKVVDHSTGGFGHINVDDFHVPVVMQKK